MGQDGMDQDDLESTMRHGLEELANDAPRGEGLWHTTTSMIAIQPDAPPLPGAEPEARPEKPPPRNLALEPRDPPRTPPPSRPPSSKLALGIAIGIAIGALIIAAIAIAIVIRNNNDSGPKRPSDVPAIGTETSLPTPAASRKPGPETSAVFPAGPIPAGDLVFDDDAKARIVVADGGLNEIGLIVPSTDAQWRALRLSKDRAHLYVVKNGAQCDELWEFDLAARKLAPLVRDANVVSLSPDGSRAVVAWDESCPGATPGTVALRVFGRNGDVELKEVSNIDEKSVAWKPDGSRFAIEPPGTHHVDTYDPDGGHLDGFDRPKSSQDGVGWTSDGLILVDLGVDNTAVVRTYNSVTGDDIGVLARVPQVKVGDDTGPLTVPQVSAIVPADGRTYVEVRGGAESLSYAQLRVVDQGRIPVIIDGWYSRHLVG